MTCLPRHPHFPGKPCVVLSGKLKWAHRYCQGPRGTLVGAKALTNQQTFLEIHFQEITFLVQPGKLVLLFLPSYYSCQSSSLSRARQVNLPPRLCIPRSFP